MKKISFLFCLLPLLFAGCQNTPQPEQKMYVGTFNIRYANDGDVERGNSWNQRRPVVTQLIRFHDFDILGTQEVLHAQLQDMLSDLPEYDYVGVARGDGDKKGEYVPIFYKKDKFKLLSSGNFWLSEDTETPNVGWDAALPRICTWAEFEWGKKKFWFMNTHFDHVGREARKQSAILMMDKVREMCGTDPVIITGDFNTGQTSEHYALFDSSDLLDDSYNVAIIRYALNGTMSGFNTNGWSENRIDHVFVSTSFDVLRYGVLTDSYRTPIELTGEEQAAAAVAPPRQGGPGGQAGQGGDQRPRRAMYAGRTPSDHYPIKVEVLFNK